MNQRQRKKLAMRGGIAVASSHVTKAQCARLIGVGHQAVAARIAAGKLPVVQIVGVEMVAMVDVHRWHAERQARPVKSSLLAPA